MFIIQPAATGSSGVGPATPNNTPNKSTPTGSGKNIAAIVGGTVAGLIGLVVIVSLVGLCLIPGDIGRVPSTKPSVPEAPILPFAGKRQLPDVEKLESAHGGLQVDVRPSSPSLSATEISNEEISANNSETEFVDTLIATWTNYSAISSGQTAGPVRSDIHVQFPTSQNNLLKSFLQNARAIYTELDRLNDSRLGLGLDILDPRFKLRTASDAMCFTGNSQTLYRDSR